MARVPKIGRQDLRKTAKNAAKQARRTKVEQAAKRKPKFSKLPDVSDDFSDLLAIYDSPEGNSDEKQTEQIPESEEPDSSDLNA